MVAAGVTVMATPLVTVILPGVTTPVPPVKTAVKLELLPTVMVAGLAVKLVIEGAALTVTVTEPVTVL